MAESVCVEWIELKVYHKSYIHKIFVTNVTSHEFVNTLVDELSDNVCV